MPRLRQLSRKPALWLGFLAVVIPLVVMLVFQYKWLVSLEQASVIANQAMLENYLEAVSTEVRYSYASNAERGLNLPASLFRGDRDLDRVADYLRRREAWGASWLFVVFIAEDGVGEVVFFQPECSCWRSPPVDPVVEAVRVASAPWVMLGQNGTSIDFLELQVDEKNPEVRMILNPITDGHRRVIGVAGMVLDPEYFQSQLLPSAIEKSLPDFYGEGDFGHFLVNVHDNRGEIRLSTTCHADCRREGEPSAMSSPPAARKAFSWVFTDWAVELESEHLSVHELARSNFILNMSLSALLGIALLGGSVFTLRTASREIRLSRMKSDFVSNVSHELRTPLASIRAFGEFLRLKRVKDLDKAAEYGEYIETESRRLTQLINNILDFSKIESGQKTYRFRVVNLRELLEGALATFKVRSQQEGFKIEFDCTEESSVLVRADSDAILQALSNLLDNAVKYSSDRREIFVRLECSADAAIISVRDYGVGISREEQVKIFERFHRVSTGLVHNVRGSGLGLSIVHHIVKAHNGEVSVASEPGYGSTFFIRLALVEDSKQQR